MIRRGSNLGGPTGRASWRSPLVVDPRASFRRRGTSNTPNQVGELMRTPLSNEDGRLHSRPVAHEARAPRRLWKLWKTFRRLHVSHKLPQPLLLLAPLRRQREDGDRYTRHHLTKCPPNRGKFRLPTLLLVLGVHSGDALGVALAAPYVCSKRFASRPAARSSLTGPDPCIPPA